VEFDDLGSRDAARVEAGLGTVDSALGTYDAAQLAPSELRQEFEAMVRLYRAVRDADAFMQTRLRSSEIGDRLLRVYYALRSTQAALSMRYAVAGPAAEAPNTSPVGTAIGLFDAPKVLAQQTHLDSGSYDSDLPRFVTWLREIWTDMRVRRADYVRFYGEEDVKAAGATVRAILDLEDAGEPILRDFSAGGADDPEVLIDRLTRFAAEGADLVGAARAIEEAGRAARSSLLGLVAHREAYQGRLGRDAVDQLESRLMSALTWRYPVGVTALVDLAAEQDAFDDLLAQLPSTPEGTLSGTEGWAARAEDALRRACMIEQSLRDHPAEYRSRYGSGRRRSFPWYVSEFSNLVDRASQRPTLGARGRRDP
jgi:hypothetical protein